ncbi:MAG: GSU3473 family protein [Desulfuromonadaceae bacterium]
MIVPAILSNASSNFVSTDELDELLQRKALLAFRRSDGWVMVGVDEMRDPLARRGSSWKDRKTVSG